MNILIIPSWYPSPSEPHTGDFIKHQAMALAVQYPEHQFGISLWGQNDEPMLLYASDPIGSFRKIMTSDKTKKNIRLNDNLVEFHHHAFTWTSKIRHGNMAQIMKANEVNLDAFVKIFGKVDIIHAHVGYPAGHIAKQLSEIHGIPYVITEHMGPFPHHYFLNNNGGLTSNLRLAYQYSSQNIVVSTALEKEMQSFDITNINCIPNMIDDVFFEQFEPPMSNKPFTFFSFGRLVPIKGMDTLLKAITEVEVPVALHIGGTGKLLDSLKSQSKALKIEHKVSWLGELTKEEALNAYQQCDAYVLASRHESMGMTYVEALACGKPVIATDCGGPSDFINPNNGVMVPIDDVNALAQAMTNMIDEHAKYDAMKIRSQASETYGSKSVCDLITQTYLEVLRR